MAVHYFACIYWTVVFAAVHFVSPAGNFMRKRAYLIAPISI